MSAPSLRWLSELACFFFEGGETTRVREVWLRAWRTSTETPRVISELLHVPVARCAMHRAQLDFAGEVLAAIPESLRSSRVDVRALDRLHKTFVEVRRFGGAVFPLTVPFETWWSGPHLGSPRAVDRWLPACVEAVDKDGVHLFAALPPTVERADPQYGHLIVPLVDFDRWVTGPERTGVLAEGRFLELVWPASSQTPEIQVHPEVEWEDPDLPPLPRMERRP